jgi:hypothetical protein
MNSPRFCSSLCENKFQVNWADFRGSKIGHNAFPDLLACYD